MVVYIELAFAENFCIDYVLLYLALKFAKLKINRWRIVLSTLLGTFFALITPLIVLPKVIFFALKILVGVAMCLLSNKSQKMKENAILILGFFLFTMILGGLLFAIFSVFNVEYYSQNGSYVINSMPILIVLAIVFVFVILFDILIEEFSKKKVLNSFIYDCNLFREGEIFSAKGFLDSGNMLYTHLGEPIIIISRKLAMKIFEMSILDLMQGERKENYFFKERIRTLNGITQINCFKIDKLVIYIEDKKNIIENVICGITVGQVENDYDIILHPYLFD